jgi:hypothetical protein
MTATVTRLVIDSLPSTPGQALSSATGGIVIVLLLGLLVVRQLVQSADRPGAGEIVQTLDIAMFPLLIAFFVIVYLRLLDLMPLG